MPDIIILDNTVHITPPRIVQDSFDVFHGNTTHKVAGQRHGSVEISVYDDNRFLEDIQSLMVTGLSFNKNDIIAGEWIFRGSFCTTEDIIVVDIEHVLHKFNIQFDSIENNQDYVKIQNRIRKIEIIDE